MTFLRKLAVLVPSIFLLWFELGCGGQYRPVVNPILPHGGQPQNTYAAFVVNYNPIGSGTTTRIDVSGDTATEIRSASTA